MLCAPLQQVGAFPGCGLIRVPVPGVVVLLRKLICLNLYSAFGRALGKEEKDRRAKEEKEKNDKEEKAKEKN